VLAAAVSGARAGAVHRWNIVTGQPLARLAPSSDIVAVAVSPAGGVIAYAGDVFSPAGGVTAHAGHMQGVTLREASSGRLVGTLDSPATCLAFSPDGTCLAVGCHREVHVWRTSEPASAT
jgi:WD40 repeat protein